VSKHPSRSYLSKTPAKTPNKHNPRDKGSAPPETNRKLNARANEKASQADKNGKRPPHERPTIFPKGLKRPDLNASVDGHAIASEFQQKLYDDITAGHCVRCHSKDHLRSACKEPAARWETKFDNEKDKYWTGTLKWQQKAAAEPASAKTKTPPTLVQKQVGFTDAKRKEGRRHTFTSDSDEDSHAPLQCRASSFPYWGVKTPPPESDDEAELTAAELREAIIESTDLRMIDYSDEEAVLLLRSDPHFVVLCRTRHTSLIMLANGTHGVFFNCDVDEARTSFAMPPPVLTGWGVGGE
jgi:hypothetical protein